jgi:hypothetical protein
VLFRRVFLLAALLAAPLASLADIGMGDSRDTVLNAHGRPTSVLRRADREIFLYPKGARVEFVDGKVVDVKGPLPPAPATPVVPVAEPAPETPRPAAAAPALAEKQAVTPTAPGASQAITPKPSPHPVPIERDYNEDAHAGFTSTVAIITLAVMLIIQFGMTFAALKIAFHYHQMDALWSGILAITSIDVGLQLVMAVVRYFQSGELILGPAGTGLPGIAMLFTLRKFCLDTRWSRVFATTSAVKLASILLNLGLLSLAYKFAG